MASPKEKLERFLSDPGRPPGTLSYHELQGFLFTIAAAPNLVRPFEWMPMVFDEAGGSYRNENEVQTVMSAMVEIYNGVVASINEGQPALPRDCRFRSQTLENLEADAPVSQWSRGFLRGHLWLEESWDLPLPKDIAEELGSIKMILTFFSSRKLAAAFAKETTKRDLAAMAESMRKLFPDAVTEYARMGRILAQTIDAQDAQDAADADDTAEAAPRPVTGPPKAGRNEPCPCGSGKKYKKCCGSAVQH